MSDKTWTNVSCLSCPYDSGSKDEIEENPLFCMFEMLRDVQDVFGYVDELEEYIKVLHHEDDDDGK